MIQLKNEVDIASPCYQKPGYAPRSRGLVDDAGQQWGYAGSSVTCFREWSFEASRYQLNKFLISVSPSFSSHSQSSKFDQLTLFFRWIRR